ncbi:FecR domain-containing protein [Terrimonas ferruginea]|uniref:FecR domain-containing protein n=1 Tax=Terrimonas ferruginea TaxID=249 RepID=UPI000422D08A|nr:FecR domain-containing protein [Terrimonas ferruginea]
MDKARLAVLFDSYVAGIITREEEMELSAFAVDPEWQEELILLEKRYWDQLDGIVDPLPQKSVSSLQTILPAKVVSVGNRWLKAMVAVWLLVLVGAGSYYAFFRAQKQPEPLVTTGSRDVKAPSHSKASVTLDDGTIVYLGQAADGQLALQGNMQLLKLPDGRFAYQAVNGNGVAGTLYNTLANPNGSKVVDMVLSDGTRIWLNAGSTVTFPVAFQGNERRITITGEAYLEVAKDKTRPFYVASEEVEVKVLGTHFNMNTYRDQNQTYVTLLEGAVNVVDVRSQKSVTLNPGQQANVTNMKIELSRQADIESVMAWKNGLFSFQNTTLENVLKEMSRWYDIKIRYEGNVNDQRFSGELPRDLSLKEVLGVLKDVGVKFRLDDNILTVIP